MFNSKKKKYDLYVLSSTTNAYGETVESWAKAKSQITMFISLSNEITTQSADMRIQQCTHIGLTNDSLNIGDRVANKYEVQFINKAGRENIVFMKEIESDGNFS